MNRRAEAEELHRRVWLAIPWVVNGTASDAQQREAQRHMSGCEDCRAEMERQTAIHDAMKGEEPPVSDVDAGLMRLRQRLDQAGDFPRTTWSPSAGAEAARAGRPRVLMYALAMAVVVETIGLSLFSYGWLTRGEQGTGDYRTLADPAPATAGAAIRMLPEPQMRVGDLQKLLLGLELQIVSGPNAAGAYALAPASKSVPLDERIARLRATPGVLLVEALTPPAKGSGK